MILLFVMKKKSVKEDYQFAGEKTPAKAVLFLMFRNTNGGGKTEAHFDKTV